MSYVELLHTHLQDLECIVVLKTPGEHPNTLVGDAVVVQVEVHQSGVELQGLS